MSKRIIIVGGGIGGTIVANGLCNILGSEIAGREISVSMLSATDKHFYQPGLFYLPFGKFRESDLYKNQKEVLDDRIDFKVDPVTKIDIQDNTITTESDNTHEYDYLVIATGSRIRPDLIPGMKESAHWFYDLDGARRLREALEDFKGGRVVINVNAPHKCPVAPVEVTFMMHSYLKERGLLEKSEITYTYPIGRLHGIEPVSNWLEPEFESLGIRSETFFNTKEIVPSKRSIETEEGASLPYELLITIPPHSGAQLIENSNLGVGGWVPTDPQTLLLEGSNNVFVLGDTTNIPISKAGSTAHFEADVIIENLSTLITEGRWAKNYDGKVFCFIETTDERATYISFNYENPPKVGAPNQMIHWAKIGYNRLYWLSIKGLL